jgi:hypothetical protein
MARDVFEEVKLSFLVIGHTHEKYQWMLWIFVKKVEGGEQLHFSGFDVGFYDLTRETIHSLVDLGNSRF